LKPSDFGYVPAYSSPKTGKGFLPALIFSPKDFKKEVSRGDGQDFPPGSDLAYFWIEPVEGPADSA
jgi:hypothetical protein